MKPKHPGGRPPKPASERASADINIRTTKATKAALKAAAKARGLSLSAHLIDLAQTVEGLRGLLQDAEKHLLAKDSLLLQNAHHMQAASECIMRMESIGSRFARHMRAMGLDESFVEDWEKVTGQKVKA